MTRFADRVAIVTGGGSGIGRATATALVEEGATVAVFDIQPGESQPGITAMTVDIRDPDAVAAAVADVADAHGGIDVLVNAAGIELVADVANTSVDDWDRVQQVNVRGSFLTIRAALPWLESRRGSVVNVASQLALVAAGHFAAYTASKSAVLGLTRSLAIELAPKGIRVNAVCPGAVDTPLLQRQFQHGPGPQGSLEDLIAMHPIGRLGRPEEIARAVLFFASDEASFATGSSIVIDGGYTAA